MKRALTASLAAVSLILFSGQATSSRGWTASAPESDDPPIHIVADLSARRLSIYEGSTEVESYPVAIGTGSKPTPRGNYTIRKIIWNPAWIPPDSKWARDKKPQPPGAKDNPMKLVKVFFKEPDYYIHGTSAVETLGEEASHGCLRMDPDDAYRVARYLMEHGGEPRDESWFWRVLHFRRETRTVYLSNPIAMAVTS
jgi:murein L,D-transpeptidase YcbB/YkuD